MQCLLIAVNAKYIHSNPAVYSLKAYAGKEYQDSIRIAEYTIQELPEEILSSVYEAHPDFIGISCYIWNWSTVSLLIPNLKKVLPDVSVWLGGPEVSFRAREILRDFPDVTGIMTGEGELSFSELIRHYGEGPGALEKVPGILYRRTSFAAAGPDDPADPFVETPPAPLLNMNRLPFTYADPDLFRNRIIYYESGRGCPFRCSYCLSSVEKSVRLKDPEIVKKELQAFLSGNVKLVKFADRTFNCREEHALAVWNYLTGHDNGISRFHFELEPDLITEKELDILTGSRPGLFQIEIGVQTTNPETLLAVNRKTDFAHLKSTVEKILGKGNVHVHLDLIAGLPYEDYNRFAQSFADVYALRPHELQLGFLKILKGTPIEKQISSFGIRYLSYPPYEILSSQWISYSEISRLKRIEAVLSIYYNSGQFSHVMPVLESFFPDSFRMYERIADFYEKNGYFEVTPSRIRRYDILLEFIAAFCGEQAIPCFSELLTFDVYLRENRKDRPAFAPRPLSGRKKSGYVHIELFSRPVWKVRAYGIYPLPDLKPLSSLREVLFDYENRDPVTGNANITLLPDEPVPSSIIRTER